MGLRAPGYTKKEMPWIEISKRRPVDAVFGECGAIRYRQLDDKDNVGDVEIVCRNGIDDIETTLQLPYFYIDGIRAWLAGEYIQNALPTLDEDVRDMLLAGPQR